MRSWALVLLVLAVLLAACSQLDTGGVGDGAANAAQRPTDTEAPADGEQTADGTGANTAGRSDVVDGQRAAATVEGGDDVTGDGRDAAASESSAEAANGTADGAHAGASTPPVGDAERADPGLVPVDADDQGAAVATLQERLDELGFTPGPVDGVFGPHTSAAIEWFQALVDLPRTGVADARTVAAIEDFDSGVETLEPGDDGAAVEQLQRRLARGPFDPGAADGVYGTKTVQAVWALEKMAGLPVDGEWGVLDARALEQLERGDLAGPSEQHGQRWVEVDLSQQVMKVYDPGASTPTLVSHVSSGNGQPWCNDDGYCGNSETPIGDFRIERRIVGWRESSLDIGRLYNPLYFNGGIAFHGALSVPAYPASHGCVRLPMHIAEYLPNALPDGTPVHVMS